MREIIDMDEMRKVGRKRLELELDEDWRMNEDDAQRKNLRNGKAYWD